MRVIYFKMLFLPSAAFWLCHHEGPATSHLSIMLLARLLRNSAICPRVAGPYRGSVLGTLRRVSRVLGRSLLVCMSVCRGGK
jgi:hypothetical protein